MKSLLVRLLSTYVSLPLDKLPSGWYIYCLRSLQTIEKRKAEHPERPLIRISSTFFWHLSSDYDLSPIPSLSSRARAIRADQIDEEEIIYEPIKVGQQVQK